MTNYITLGPNQAPSEKFVDSKNSPAVMKLRLSMFRSKCPTVTVFAFEGESDKTVYAEWVKRIREDLEYEPFVCNGKTGVLNLAEAVARDQSGDGKCVYCFVDRDYDDLRGKDSYSFLYMTPTYSIENALVDADVLKSLLTNEFHCNGEPAIRSKIVSLFNGVYEKFLGLTKETNLHLFTLRKLNRLPQSSLPEKLNSFFNIELCDVAAGFGLEAVVSCEGVSLAAEATKYSSEFEELLPRERYRGKWALHFFQEWLRLLVKEYKGRETGVFDGIAKKAKVPENALVITTFAARSRLPDGLRDFVVGAEAVK